ncbi:MAG TPA: hypothetical protein VMU51_23145 [Mycobacteriales bacterium]|nr:hypothetical protein [Mycobacteriales bacterium]
MPDVSSGTAAMARLVLAPDGDEYVLGRPDLGLYVAVPEPAAVLIRALQGGATLAAATERASESAGSEVDSADFLAGLAEIGLLAEPGPADGTPAVGGRQIRWIAGVNPGTAAWFFGRTAWLCYGAAAVFVLAALIVRPDLRPSFEDIWFLGDPALSMLSLAPISVLLAGGHEAWHWLAGRALGVPAVFRVSRRGIWLVFETDLTQVVTLPRRQRYSPFLAGMAWDTSLLAGALALRLLYRADRLALPPTLDRLLGVVVLTQVVTLTWQGVAIFLRTDGYAVLANALRCHNLYRASWLTTKDRFWRLTPAETTELAEVSEHDRRVARWFGLGYALGLAATGWLTLNVGLPFLLGMTLWLVNNLGHPAPGSLAFWESLAVLVLLLAQSLGPVLFGLRERRLRKQGVLL